MDFAIFKWRFIEGEGAIFLNSGKIVTMLFCTVPHRFYHRFYGLLLDARKKNQRFHRESSIFFSSNEIICGEQLHGAFLMKVFIVLKFYCFSKFNNISSFRSFRYPVERLDFRPGSEGHFWVIFSRFVKIDRSHLTQFWPKFP